jgi:hypothetical protein
MPAPKKPLHERVKMLGWIRNPARDLFFHVLRKAAATDEYRSMAASALNGLLGARPEPGNGLADQPEPGFPELGQASKQTPTADRSDIIFITARFRSGSTLLWNLFRNVPGCTSYYEPLNERRWFDPHSRGVRVDQTHRGVEDYWKEYDNLPELGRFYRQSWTERNFLMGPEFWDPDLKRYIEVLVEKAPGRPVLQFNRVDFRLPWLRRHFPNARVLHLYRHPRDQWCSALQDNKNCPPDGTFADFSRHDGFYLRSWAHDLKHHFPFLDESRLDHPYQLFYLVWKLSYLFGRKYSHHSIAFDRLVAEPGPQLRQVMSAVDLAGCDFGKLESLIARPALGKWEDYAEDVWFRRHEEFCETELQEFFRTLRRT